MVGTEEGLHIKIDLSEDHIKELVDKIVDDEDDDFEELSEGELQKKARIVSAVKILFLSMATLSVAIFPYEIIMDKSFGLGKAFLRVFWGGTCFWLATSVAKAQIIIKRRLKELRSAPSSACSAAMLHEAP
jgi:hypothetical protein